MRVIKIFALLSLFLLFSIPVLAADETLLSSDITENGGYGGMEIKATSIYNTSGIMTGGYGGWLINRKFMIGLGGSNLISQVKAPDVVQTGSDTYYINFYYYGLKFEYIDSPSKLIHFSGSVLVGAGSVNYTFINTIDKIGRANCFVVEPSAKLMLNVNNWFRTGVGASYRYVNGVNMPGLSNNDLSGMSYNVTLLFGKF